MASMERRADRGGFEALDNVDGRIMRAVFELMRTTSIDRMRVSDVTALAGVSRATFYRRFLNVNDVVKTFENALLDNMRSINNVALKARFNVAELEPTATMVSRMETLLQYRDEIVALNGPHGDPSFVHKATVLMHDYLSDRLSEVLGPSDELELYLAFILAGHLNLIQFWLEKRSDIAPRKVAATLNRLYYAPFFLGEKGTAIPRGLNLD